jgi:hypothetical protein
MVDGVQQTQPRTTQLGATGLEITRVGFGRSELSASPGYRAISTSSSGDDVDETEGR